MLQLSLEDLKTHDNASALCAQDLPAGALHIGDLGFFDLDRFAQWRQAGVEGVMRYKALKAGSGVVLVAPAYTSQDCSGCSYRVEKDLSVRVHVCPKCSLELDQDVNAARNIYKRAFKSAGTPPSDANVDHSVKRSLRSSRLSRESGHVQFVNSNNDQPIPSSFR